MAIDLSNVGPGSVSAKQAAQSRRARLARRRQRPLTGPGSAGLGIGPEQGVRNRGSLYQVAPRQTFVNHSAPTISSTPRSYTDAQFQNIDTMLFRDRLGAARAFYATDGKSFKFRQDEIPQLIKSGIFSYGKGEGMKYPGLVASANLPALNSFLKDNFEQKGSKFKRTNKNLKLSDNTIQYLTYGGLDASMPQQEYVQDYSSGKVVRNARSPVQFFERVPKIGKGDDAKVDYASMADSYSKDAEQEARWKSKIVGKVQKEGGSALWNKIMSGKYTPQDVQALRQYMYSPNGEYGDAQEKFIQETLLNNGGSSPKELLANQSVEQLKDLAEEKAKQDAKDAKAQSERIKDMYDTNFNPALGVEAQFNNLITALTGVGAGPNGEDTIGQGDYITPGMIDAIMRQGVGTYVADSSVTGGKRFVPAPLRGFSVQQKAALLKAVQYASDQGYTIPPGLYQYIDPLAKEVLAAAEKGTRLDDPEQNVYFKVGPFEFTEADIPSSDAFWRGMTGEKDPEARSLVTARDLQAFTAPLMESSILKATPADQASFVDWLVNFPKGLARMGVGFVPGAVYLAENPTETVKQFGEYYWNTYTDWDNFKTVFVEDPLAPIMDGLALVSGVGMGVKGAQIASAAGRLSKAEKIVGMAPVELAEGKGTWIPSSPPAGETPIIGGGISRRDYAALMRKAAGGDPAARLRLEVLLPRGTEASNSLLNPTALDRAASFFEPQFKYVTRSDGNASFVDKSRVAMDGDEQAAIRFTGNPINRGIQKVFFTAAQRGGKRSGRIANLPYLGFNYRFDKAMKETNLVVIDGIRQELAMLNAYHKSVDEMKLSDMEQQVVMDTLTGGAYSPSMLTAIKRRKLQEDAKGMATDYRELLEADIRRMTDPEFLDEYARVKAEMLDGSTPRGKDLAKAHMALTMMLAKQNRLLAAFDSPATIEAALRAYAPVSEAARLTARDFQRELGADIGNVGMINPNYHFAEQMKAFVEDSPFGPLTKEDANVMDMLKSLEAGMKKMAEDHAFRDLGGNPFFIVDEVVRSAEGEPILVRGRRMRIEGNIHEDGNMERSGLIDPEPITLPASAFVPSKGEKAGVMTMNPEQALMQLRIGATNFLNKTFPNVRDVTDKISDRSINTTESFANRQNRNIVTMSGLQDYHLKVQFDAHRTYLQRRVNEGWDHFFNTTMIPMAAGEFDNRFYVALKTQKVFDTREAAEAYAQNYDALGAVEPGLVSEKVINGETKFVTSLRYFDAMKSTIIDQQLKQIRGTEDFEKSYIMDLKDIEKVNPDDILMVVPRSTYNKFKDINHRIDRALHDTFIGKTGGLLSSLFKLFTLSMNPKWLPQSVIGSSMMVGMATPEMFPSVMAGLWQTAARRAKGKLTGEERDIFSHHVDDFNYFTRRDPHSFVDNIYYQDRQTDFMGRMGDSRLAKYTVGLGYTTVFAFESNLRASLYREVALRYPGFKSLMKSPEIEKIAAAGRPDIGLERLSRFQATFEALSNPESPLYDANFMTEVKYTTDGVLGNYRDFSHTERAIRNYLIPFYAWQRHSALFTYRLFKERPLQANAIYQIGNMGFDKVMAAGGIPEWLYESVPMPDALVDYLDLDPERVNRLMVGSVNPLSATTDGLMFAGSLLAGQGVVPSAKSLFDYTNPFINAVVSQTTGMNLLTGQPLSEEEKNRGLGESFAHLFTGFPGISAVLNGFKSATELNQFRGNESPTDIFVDFGDPDSKLSIPQDKLSEKFTTDSKAGLFNLISPARAVSLDAEQMIKNYQRDMKKRGIKVGKGTFESTTLMKHTNALIEWKRKADFINKYWMPTYGKSYPDVAQRVMAQLAREFPSIPKNYPRELYSQVLGGGLM